LINYFSEFRFVDPFRRYSRSKSKVVRNRAKFWTVFALRNFGGRPSKNCTHVITSGPRHVVWIKICDDIPITAEVIDVHTLNFKPNFKFSRLKFFLGGPLSQVGCALGSRGQSLARIKISGRSTPLGPKYGLPKKCPLGWVNMHVNVFFVCGPKFTVFYFLPTWEGL